MPKIKISVVNFPLNTIHNTSNNKNKSVIVLKKTVKQNAEELGIKPPEGLNKNNISFRGIYFRCIII